MNKHIFLLLWMAVAQIVPVQNVYAMAEKPVTTSSAQETSEDEIPNEFIKDPNQIAKARLQGSAVPLNRIQKENVLLTKILQEIENPKAGENEVLRQEKMRQVIARVNKNLESIDKLRKEQEEQMKRIRQQQEVLNQQKNLPR